MVLFLSAIFPELHTGLSQPVTNAELPSSKDRYPQPLFSIDKECKIPEIDPKQAVKLVELLTK